MSLDYHISPLFDTISKIRRDIIRNIMPHTHKGNLALGPVLFFIEDSTQQCLYNWSDVSWEELSLGNLVKEVLRDIEDITHFISKELSKKLSIEEEQNSSQVQIVITKVKSINKWCKTLFEENIEDYFDDHPLFKLKFKKWKFMSHVSDIGQEHETFDSFRDLVALIEVCFKSFRTELPQNIFNELNDKFKKSQHRENSQKLPELLKTLYNISEGRYKAFGELKDVFGKYTKGQLDEIKMLIANHPGFTTEKLSTEGNRISKWDDFRQKIKAYEPEKEESNLNYEDKSSKYSGLIRYAIEIYNYLPQEIASSEPYKELKKINNDEYKNRIDKANIKLADLVHHPEVEDYELEKLEKKYPIYYLTHHFERLFYQASSNYSEDKSKIKNILVLPVKVFNSQVIGQVVVISPELIDKTTVINAVEAYLPNIREAARSGFKAGIISEAIDDSERINAPFDETGYLAQYISKILSNKGFAILKKNSNTSWTLCRRTKRVSLSDINHEIPELDHILRDKQNDFQVFINWFESQLTKKITQENECYNVFSIYKDTPAKMAFKQLLGGSANEVLKKEGYPKSCFIALLKREISVAVFFEEDEMIIGLSGHEIFSLMNDISEQLLLLKGKKTATNYKMIASQMAHDAKFLDGIISNIDKLILETHGTVKDTLEIVELPLVDFRDQLTFILAAYHPDYESAIGTYKRKERKSYVICDEIKKILNELLTESHIRVLRNKISSGKGNPLKGNRLMAIWNSLGRNIVEFKLENDILTQLNILSLRIILRGLFQNAIIHTDWENNIFEVPQKAPSIVKIECIKNISTIKLRVSNIPKEINKDMIDVPEIFFEYARSPHIIMIGKAVEVSTGGKNIRFTNCQEDSKYISVEICIPIK